MRFLISGGTGFLGQALCNYWLSHEHHITLLSRRPERAKSQFSSTIQAVATLNDIANDTHFDIFVNLAGEPVAEGRWTEDIKHRILHSRLDTTSAMNSLARRLTTPPKVFLSASAIGYYGNRNDELLIESSGPQHSDFLSKVCEQWEQAAMEPTLPDTRTVLLRIGLVLGKGGGPLARMLPIFRSFAGGKLGSGTQYMSWIHLQDVVALFEYMRTHASLSGVFNLTAPNPVTNADFTKALGKAVQRPAIVPVPSFALRTLYGEMADILLGGQRVMPQRLLDNGYAFQFLTIDDALRDLVS
jgi:uncharacterized protein